MVGGNSKHVGTANAARPTVDAPDGTAVELFTLGTAFRTESPTFSADGATLYIGNDDYKVYAIDSTTGAEQWNVATSSFNSVPAALAADGTIYIGTGGVVFRSAAVGADGTVYFSSFDDKTYALHASNGTEKWSFLMTGDGFSHIAIAADGTVYTADYSGKLFAIHPDGTEAWTYSGATAGYESGITVSPIDGTIYAGNNDNRMHAVWPNGTQRWTCTTGGAIFSTPALADDGTLYFGSNDNYLYAVHANGTLRWRYQIADDVWGSPCIGGDGTVYFGSLDYKVYALRPDGTLKWSFTTTSFVRGSPAIGLDGSVYVGNSGRKLYKFPVATGI